MKLSSSLNEMKKWILLVLIGVVAYWGLNNFDVIGKGLGKLYVVFSPFILGFVLAYILNIPTMKMEKLLKKLIPDKYEEKYKGVIRIISIVLSLLLLILILVLVMFLLIPELIDNIEMLMKSIPGVIDSTEKFAIDLLDKYPEVQIQIKDFFSEGAVTKIATSILNYFINGAVGFVSNLVGGFVKVFTAIIFAIYMLCQKEHLIDCIKKLIFAYTDKKKSDKLMEVATLTNKTFSNFISGQCVEAVILGTIIFVVSLLFGFPYALLIGVLTTITALIPIFGAFIAAGIGALLIAITNPIQAIIFVIVFLVIQQIEGNLIYPKVVGKSVGLSPLWTLLAITVGGNMFGIAGMLIGLPLASVVYALVKSNVVIKLKKRKNEV